MENNNKRIAIMAGVAVFLAAGMVFYVMVKIRQPVEVDGGYRQVMGTFARIVAVARHERQAISCIEAGFGELKRIDAIMSDYKQDSQLSKVNREAFANPVKVSSELFEILQKSVEYSKLTNGAFDITVGPLVDLWHKAGETNTMPDENTLTSVKSRVGYKKLILDANEQTVRFAVEGMRLDLGAIAKGYAVDKAVEAMQRCGASGGMVDAGGNIRCFGMHANRNIWMFGLQDPNSANKNEMGQIPIVMKLKDMSVATSGDYRRFVTVGGKKVSHIIDTSSATGAKKLSSDTIIAVKAVDADALSTAVNVLGVEKGLTLIESLDGVEAILITAGPDYRVFKSRGADRYLQ
jgi:FAD:protein FMN transferase